MRDRAGLALLFSACAACASPVSVPEARLYTLRDLAGSAYASSFVRRGDPLRLLSPPFSDAPAAQDPALDGLTVFPAFSEGGPAAYLTTEVWEEFPKVWVQPLYLMVSDFAASGPVVLPLEPVFAVDVTSRFYSPYWQIFYARVPSDTPRGALTSARLVRDAALEIRPGPPTFCSLGPNQLGAAHVAGKGPVRPLTQTPVLDPPLRHAWAEGNETWFIDFGRNRFRYDEHLVVEESALFAFALRDAAGQRVPLDLPKVGGTGPLHSPQPAIAPGGRPVFGGLWHEYTVLLPAGAGPWVPGSQPQLRASLPASLQALFPAVDPPSTPADYTLRVALNAAQCFGNAAFPAGPCQWLDSQAAIEASLADFSFEDTGRLLSCPLLQYHGQAVPLQ